MTTTTDFETWLSENEPESFDEACCLYDAVSGDSSGIYSGSVKNGTVYITRSGGDTTLALVSEKAIASFKKHIECYNPHPELGWHGADVFARAMAKDD